jgi:hypothetical protein
VTYRQSLFAFLNTLTMLVSASVHLERFCPIAMMELMGGDFVRGVEGHSALRSNHIDDVALDSD